MVRLLIQIDNQIYALGLSPKDTTDFVQKTEKGVMNLSTFSHECSIKNLSYSNWYTSYNHKELHILDHYSIPK